MIFKKIKKKNHFQDKYKKLLLEFHLNKFNIKSNFDKSSFKKII